MIVGKSRGKALLVIERLDSRWVPYAVTAHVQSCSGGRDARECVLEDFDLLTTESLPIPDAAHKLDIGGRLWVAVTYEFTYLRDYWGECDTTLGYKKQRVLKRMPPPRQ